MTRKSKIILSIAVLWLLTGFGLLYFYPKFDWRVIYGFATWILAAGVVFAIWQIVITGENTKRQLWEARWRAKIEFTVKRLEKLNNLVCKEALGIVCEKTPSKLSDLEREEQNKVVELFERMHTLGLLVEKGYADKELAIVAHRGKFITYWYKAMPCICYERERCGKYGEGIEYLAKEAYKYQQENLAKSQWVKLDHKICEIDVSKSCKTN